MLSVVCLPTVKVTMYLGHACTHTHKCTCTHAHAHMHTHTRTHTHTHTHKVHTPSVQPVLLCLQLFLPAICGSCPWPLAHSSASPLGWSSAFPSGHPPTGPGKAGRRERCVCVCLCVCVWCVWGVCMCVFICLSYQNSSCSLYPGCVVRRQLGHGS